VAYNISLNTVFFIRPINDMHRTAFMGLKFNPV